MFGTSIYIRKDWVCAKAQSFANLKGLWMNGLNKEVMTWWTQLKLLELSWTTL